MRTQSVLLIAAFAVICLSVGTTEAIKCYSCIYSAENPNAKVPFPGAPKQDPRCGKRLGAGLTSRTFPDETEFEFYGFAIPGDTDVVESSTWRPGNFQPGFEKFLRVKRGEKRPYLHKVYCGMVSGYFEGFGHLIARGIGAGDSLSVKDGCKEEDGQMWCSCSTDECNASCLGAGSNSTSHQCCQCSPASGVQVSTVLIAVSFVISKLCIETAF